MQSALCGNELERHLSVWEARDFRALGEVDVFEAPGDVLVAVYRLGGAPRVSPQESRIPASLWQRQLLPLAQRLVPSTVREKLRKPLRPVLRFLDRL